jgi:hypothetical protein
MPLPQPEPIKLAQSRDGIKSGRYKILGGGAEVLDTQTKLIWQRCSLGQRWNGRICEGIYQEFSTTQLRNLASRGWRVPTVRELHSLVWCSNGADREAETDVGDGRGKLGAGCKGNPGKDYESPTIDTKAFPNTPNTPYWTSSSGKDESDIWRVSFSSGSLQSFYLPLFGGYAARLVRTSQ